MSTQAAPVNDEFWVETSAPDGKKYFYHMKTRETKWEKPEGTVVKQEDLAGIAESLKKAGQAAQTTAAGAVAAPATQVTQTNAPNTGYPPNTARAPHPNAPAMAPPAYRGMPPPWAQPGGLMQRPPPGYGFPPPGLPPPGFAPPFGQFPPAFNPHAAQQQRPPPGYPMRGEAPPLPEGWTEHRTQDGRPYWFNKNTNKSSWERPEPTAAAEPAKAEVKAQTGPKPIANRNIPGTPWAVVWTNDGKHFFFNPSQSQSVWKVPPDLIGNEVLEKMLAEGAPTKEAKKTEEKKPAAAAETTTTAVASESDDGEIKGVVSEVDSDGEESKKDVNEETSNLPAAKDLTSGFMRIDTKDGAVAAAMEAAKQREKIPLEERQQQFTALLEEKNIAAFSSYEKELKKLVFDPRYLLLNSKERRDCFNTYCAQRAEKDREEKRRQFREIKENFIALMEEAKISGKSHFADFASRYGRDERFRAIEKHRERETLFQDYVKDLIEKEREERRAKKAKVKENFIEMLRECEDLHRRSHWNSMKRVFRDDERYIEVESSTYRELWFEEHCSTLAKKIMTKEEGEIDDDESEGDDNAGEERGKRSDKDGRRKRSKHYDDEQYEGRREKRKRRKRDRSREKSKHKRSADRRREGDDDEDRDASFSGSDSEGLSVDRKDRRASPSVKESQSGVLPEARSRSRTSSGNTSEQAEVARKDREKEKRVAESLRAREEEVREHLSTIQKETQQKLGESKRSEALATYNSMLADLIRHTDYDYREARRKMKKDARYDDMADVLEPSEREKIFDEHIKSLKEKKRERFFELLKQVDVKLDTAWRDVKKLVKGDPRYEKFSSSERKAEKSVREYQKTLLRDAREDFKQLLRESKFIDHKSADKFTDEEYLCEIVEKLKMDKRYLELEPVGTETLSLLKEYAEELKRRGPPPPPTVPDANVSWRR